MGRIFRSPLSTVAIPCQLLPTLRRIPLLPFIPSGLSAFGSVPFGHSRTERGYDRRT